MAGKDWGSVEPETHYRPKTGNRKPPAPRQKWESEWNTAMSTHGNCKDNEQKEEQEKAKRKSKSGRDTNYKLELATEQRMAQSKR